MQGAYSFRWIAQACGLDRRLRRGSFSGPCLGRGQSFPRLLALPAVAYGPVLRQPRDLVPCIRCSSLLSVLPPTGDNGKCTVSVKEDR